MRNAKGAVVVTPDMARGLRLAIEAAGNKYRLAKDLGIDPGGVQRWVKVPAEWCREIERLYGVAKAALRPDLFGDDGGS